MYIFVLRYIGWLFCITTNLFTEDAGRVVHISRARAFEVGVNLSRELTIVRHAMVMVTFSLLGPTGSLDGLPLCSHISNLGLPVRLRIIGLVETTDALPQTQVLGVDSNPVILIGLAVTNISPPALLFLEVETGCVWEVEEGKEHASKTKPRNNVELGLVVDVVVEYRGKQSTGLAHAGRESVSSGTDGSRENLAGNQESDRVGAELVEEGRQKVHGLEGMNAFRTSIVLVAEGRDDEHEEAHEEANLLHHLAAVKLVVDEKRCKIVTSQRDGDVDQVPSPVRHERAGVVRDNLDELTLE